MAGDIAERRKADALSKPSTCSSVRKLKRIDCDGGRTLGIVSAVAFVHAQPRGLSAGEYFAGGDCSHTTEPIARHLLSEQGDEINPKLL